MKPGAARNAVDCALWDLEAKISGIRVAEMLGNASPAPLETAFTLSLGTPEAMAAQASDNAARPLLKVKIGGEGDIARIRAVREAAPASRLILDANEGWTDRNIERNLAAAAELGVSLVEQPLPAGEDAILAGSRSGADLRRRERAHGRRTRRARRPLRCDQHQARQGGRADRRAGAARRAPAELGFGIMVGCMVGTSLAMAPAVLLAQGADFVDLDGPLLLARDRQPGLLYRGSLVSPPEPALWG